MDIASNELFNAIQYTLDNNSLIKGYIDGLSSRLKNEWNMSYKMDDVLNVHSNVQTNDRVLQLKCVKTGGAPKQPNTLKTRAFSTKK